MSSSLFLPWKHVSEQQVEELEKTTDQATIKELLKQIFKITFSDSRKSQIAVDFHFYNYAFCKEKGLNAIKISTFLSMANECLIQDSGDPSATRTKSFEYFRNELFKHSIERSPRSIKVFEEEEVEAILTYFVNSYYRHFQLYKYVFSSFDRTVLKQMCLNEVEKPRVAMLPLADALLMLPVEVEPPAST